MRQLQFRGLFGHSPGADGRGGSGLPGHRLRLAILALVAFAAGAPVADAQAQTAAQTPYPELTRRLQPEKAPADFLILVDRSGSMAPHWPEVLRAKAALERQFSRQYDSVVWRSFAEDVRPFEASTPDGRSTNVLEAARAATEWLTRREGDRLQFVFFLTDGIQSPALPADSPSVASVRQSCHQVAKNRQVDFIAVELGRTIDFQFLASLCPNLQRESLGEMARQVQVRKLARLVRSEYKRAADAAKFVGLDSVLPRSEQEETAGAADMRAGGAATVFLTLRSPYRGLRVCLENLAVSAADGFVAELLTGPVPACVEPTKGAQVAITLTAAEPTLWQRVKPWVSGAESVPLAIALEAAPEPRVELENLGEYERPQLAQTVEIPAVVTTGIWAGWHVLGGIALLLLILYLIPGRVWGTVQAKASAANRRAVFEEPEGVEVQLGSAKRRKVRVRLLNGAELEFIARKVNPLGLNGFHSHVGVRPVRGSTIDVRQHDDLVSSSKAVVWLSPDAEITVVGPDSSEVPLVWK